MSERSSTFYIIDLDRTLFDTNKASQMIVEEIAKIDESVVSEIQRQITEFTNLGSSFSIRDSTIALIGEEKTSIVETRFMERAWQEGVFLEGAEDLLAAISASGASFGILTYGSPAGQLTKLKAAKLDTLPYIITDQSHKGSLIRSWQQDNGSFVLPEEYGLKVVERLVFIDDRLFSFDGLPERAIGYWVAPQLSILDAVEHPASVQPVLSLTEVIQREKLDEA